MRQKRFQGGESADTVARKKGYMQDAQQTRLWEASAAETYMAATLQCEP